MIFSKVADYILVSNTIFTGQDKEPVSGALAVKDKQIIAVDDFVHIKKYIGKQTEVLHYGDKLIMPGFNDFHVHLFAGSLWADSVSLAGAKSEEEAAKMVKDFADTRPDDPWIFGFNWYHIYWDSKALPHRKTLDLHFPDRPVFLMNDELHGAWVNTKALELMGINDETPNPPFGEIQRDEDGRATGFLYETAMGFAQLAFDSIPMEQQEKLMDKFMQYAAKYGVTSVSDMLPLPGLQLGNLDLYDKYCKEDKLTVRINFLAALDGDLAHAEKLKEKYNSGTLTFSGLKQFLDGVPPTYTAYLVEPYANKPETRGITLIPPEYVKDWIIDADKAGFRVRLHACGDAGVKLGLDCFEAAEQANGKRDSRHTIEHVELIHQNDITRFAALDVIASLQPEHMSAASLDASAYPALFGKERDHLSFPNKLLQDNGARIAFGSDFPVVDMNPMLEIYRAMTRVHDDGEPAGGWNPQEKISLSDALKHYTVDAAHGVFRENDLGTLAADKLADIVVLDRNLFTASPLEIKEAAVELTMMDGKIVYQK